MDTSSGLSTQAQAEAFLEELKNGKDESQSYIWPKIDFSEVSDRTIDNLSIRIQGGSTPPPPRSLAYTDVAETPHRERIARQLEFIKVQRLFLWKQRIVEAGAIHDDLRQHLVLIQDFLKAARRGNEPKFVFPHPEHQILASVSNVRALLMKVEEMVRVNMELDNGSVTETDSQASALESMWQNWRRAHGINTNVDIVENPDETLVGIKTESPEY
ncbi:hypothetical protein R3P38DRAFT_2843339 [Favolaschia claudopus]|uniref:Uncharacterized protein n=1 Tax=Favolaschia claudopus TaxID=2862362 RepID=A0AAW0DY90_9AGAR